MNLYQIYRFEKNNVLCIEHYCTQEWRKTIQICLVAFKQYNNNIIQKKRERDRRGKRISSIYRYIIDQSPQL